MYPKQTLKLIFELYTRWFFISSSCWFHPLFRFFSVPDHLLGKYKFSHPLVPYHFHLKITILRYSIDESYDELLPRSSNRNSIIHNLNSSRQPHFPSWFVLGSNCFFTHFSRLFHIFPSYSPSLILLLLFPQFSPRLFSFICSYLMLYVILNWYLPISIAYVASIASWAHPGVLLN